MKKNKMNRMNKMNKSDRQVVSESHAKWRKAGICVLLCISMAAASGCGRENKKDNSTAGEETEAAYRNDVSAQDLKTKVAEELGERYWPNMQLGEQELDTLMGIKADYYEEAAAEMPMISTNVDTLIILKAKEGQLQAAEDALKSYRENLVNDTMQYPMNLGKIQASMVRTFGNYVCFVQLGADAIDASEEEEIIKKCQEDNEKALNIIENALKEA